MRALYAAMPANLVASWDAYAALMRATAGPVLHPEFEFEFVGPGDMIGVTGPRRGVEGFLGALSEWLESFESYRVEPEQFLDRDDQVLVLHRHGGRSRDAGVEYIQESADLWTFRDRKAWRVRSFMHRDEARRAAGLPEQAVPGENLTRAKR